MPHSKFRNALALLSEFALNKSASSPADQLAVYEALALLGKGDEFGDAAERIAHARRVAAEAEREVEVRQEEFKALTGGDGK